MRIGFFYTLRAAGPPVSVREYLTLLQALQAGVVGLLSAEAWSIDDFDHLSRTTLVKDERHYDKFDRAFAACFHEVECIADSRGWKRRCSRCPNDDAPAGAARPACACRGDRSGPAEIGKPVHGNSQRGWMTPPPVQSARAARRSSMDRTAAS